MGKGSRIIPVRIGGELLAEIQRTIERRNHLTRETPWDMSAFIHAAIGDKLRHLRRAAQQTARRRMTATAEGQSPIPSVAPAPEPTPAAIVGNFYGEGKPTSPTDAKPGTPEKVEVLERRAVAGEVLFHPEDAV